MDQIMREVWIAVLRKSYSTKRPNTQESSECEILSWENRDSWRI